MNWAPHSQPPAFEIGGVRIDAITLSDAVSIIESWIVTRRRDYVVLTGAHGVVEMQDDPELRSINNAAGLVTPDGMPNVWMGRWKGHHEIEKVYAPNLMNAVFAHGLSRGYGHFLYGGKEGVADELAAVLVKRLPAIRIVGTFCPPFRALATDEIEEIVHHINRTEADIVWVGLGCPKQERWMGQFRPLLRTPVLVGVGAGFDFLSGQIALAPRWIQRSGFEWLYRTLSEPRRLWPRYSKVVPRYSRIWLREVLHRTGKFPSSA